MAMGPEAKVKADVKRLLKSMNIWYYMPVQNGMGVVGIPDFICCWKGEFVAIETKAPGKIKNVSANQQARMAEIKRSGGYTLVVDSAEMLGMQLAVMRVVKRIDGACLHESK
ncbi:MAG: VRR-NUC domain-containing protein [Geobacteraceae bacterium]|nr:VRR-NUC domain-containing protein [Geobacteraceae bacterium]